MLDAPRFGRVRKSLITVAHAGSYSRRPLQAWRLAEPDLFLSIRFETVVNGIEAFTTWVISQEDAGGPGRAADVE